MKSLNLKRCNSNCCHARKSNNDVSRKGWAIFSHFLRFMKTHNYHTSQIDKHRNKKIRKKVVNFETLCTLATHLQHHSFDHHFESPKPQKNHRLVE